MSTAKSKTPSPEPPDAEAPRNTAKLIGQAGAEAVLLAAERSGRLPHAWLLTGPRGVGKATLAYRFARYLFAGGGAGLDDGGLFGEAAPPSSLALEPDHPVFRRVASGGHSDLRVLQRGLDDKGKLKRDIAVDDVRAAIGTLHLTPAEGGWRILIVDSADDLNLSSANALLKILEEPPQKSILLLISHQPGRLLPTIRSRCRRLALRPLDPSDVEALLDAYRPGLPPGDVATLAHLADGSIGRALLLADSGGLDLYGEEIGLLGDLPRLDVGRLHGFAEKLGRDTTGASFRTGTELLIWWLAQMIRSGAEDGPLKTVSAEENALMRRLMEPRGLAPWLALWEKLGRLFARTEAVSLDRKQVLLAAFLEMQALAAPPSRQGGNAGGRAGSVRGKTVAESGGARP